MYNSFFAKSVLTFLASLQIIFNLENGQLKFLDNFLYLLSTIYSRQERVNSDLNVKVLVGAFNQEKVIVK